ncbi:MAG: potassium transporter TrkG [Pseudomonadota bacterium]
MNLVATFRLLGFGIVILGTLMTVPFLSALGKEGANASGYFFGSLVSLFCGWGLLILGAGRALPEDIRETMLCVVLWWTLAPLFGAVPFMFEGLSGVQAYFEAVSALTTTGAWLSEEAARSSQSTILWRALMQWLGGFTSLAIAAAIFIRPVFVGVDTVQAPFARGEQSSYGQALFTAGKTFLLAYVGVTFLASLMLALAGAPAFDAMILAMSTMASGGFIPSNEGVSAYSPMVLATLLPFLFLSGVNFIFIAGISLGRQPRLQDTETGAYCLIVFSVAVLLVMLAGTGRVVEAPLHLFNAASLMSTNAVTVGSPPPLALALVAVLIGGSALSTAGGLKIVRWLIVFTRARQEIRRLIMPSQIFGRTKISEELGVWMHFIVFTFFVGGVTLVVTSGGHPFDLSATVAIGALSNAGPVIHLLEGEQVGYGIIENPMLQLMLCAAMILGRVEVVTVLVLFNRAFWRS